MCSQFFTLQVSVFSGFFFCTFAIDYFHSRHCDSLESVSVDSGVWPKWNCCHVPHTCDSISRDPLPAFQAAPYYQLVFDGEAFLLVFPLNYINTWMCCHLSVPSLQLSQQACLRWTVPRLESRWDQSAAAGGGDKKLQSSLTVSSRLQGIYRKRHRYHVRSPVGYL